MTEFFDAVIKIQQYGYKVHYIDADEYKNYFVRFALTDVVSNCAFGGLQYEMDFRRGSSQPSMVSKFIFKKLELVMDESNEISTLDEAVNYIITDIEKINKQLEEEERQRILQKLTQREREILGVS